MTSVTVLRMGTERRYQAVVIGAAARSNLDLDEIFRGGGGVGAAGGCSPSQDAWLGLFEPPALGLFDPVVMPAQRGQVAFARDPAAVPRCRVVQVAVDGGVAAAGCGAGGVAGGDEVAEFAAGAVGG